MRLAAFYKWGVVVVVVVVGTREGKERGELGENRLQGAHIRGVIDAANKDHEKACLVPRLYPDFSPTRNCQVSPAPLSGLQCCTKLSGVPCPAIRTSVVRETVKCVTRYMNNRSVYRFCVFATVPHCKNDEVNVSFLVPCTRPSPDQYRNIP